MLKNKARKKYFKYIKQLQCMALFGTSSKLYLKTAFMRTKCKHLIFCVIKELLLNFLRSDNATVVISLQTDISQMSDIAPKLE